MREEPSPFNPISAAQIKAESITLFSISSLKIQNAITSSVILSTM
jgi:hypothetical protein